MASGLVLAMMAQPMRRPRRKRRPRIQRNPLNIERQYAAKLRGVADSAIDEVGRRILPQLDRWSRLAGVRTDQIDDWIDELEAEFTVIRREFGRQDGQFRQLAETVATSTSTFNRVEVGRQVSGVVGGTIVPLSDDTDTIKGFVQQNVAAIKTIPEQHFARVERIIGEGFRSGRRAEALRDEIAKIGGVTKRRAQFIARDQISTLNAQLTQRRQRALGIDEYVWRTSRDERVRASHRQLEGTTQSWDSPPTVGARQVHPGEDYNCRCTPEPKIDGLEPEDTGPEDIPPPMRRRPLGRARRRPGGRAAALAGAARRRGRPATRDIPVSAEPATVAMPRTGNPVVFTAEQSLRREVAAVLDQYPELRQRATTSQRLDRLLWSWVHGTNRRASVELKKAAVAEFGLRGTAFNRHGRFVDPRDVSQSQKDLRALYRATQRDFADKGRRTVTAYRGYRADRERGAVESWSTSEAQAAKFAGPNGGIEEKQIPVDRILAIRGGPHWLDGVWGNQGEVLVLY